MPYDGRTIGMSGEGDPVTDRRKQGSLRRFVAESARTLGDPFPEGVEEPIPLAFLTNDSSGGEARISERDQGGLPCGIPAQTR